MKENRLIIIGNGFDMSHSIETGYMDFKKYMLSNKSDNLTKSFVSTEKYFSANTKELIDVLFNIVDKACIYTAKIIDEKYEWNTFEEALGNINYKEIMQTYVDFGENANDISLTILHIFMWLEGCFKEWISEVNYENATKMFAFNGNDLFLTFNYTRTLEYLYKIKNNNICHIHGSVDFKNIKMHEDDFVFGHNKEIIDIDYCNDENFKKVAELLRKNKETYKDRYNSFLRKVQKSNIAKIYDFGFSYSDVDKSYIKDLINIVDCSKVEWFSDSYDKSKDEREKIIKKLGFNGKIIVTDKNDKCGIML